MKSLYQFARWIMIIVLAVTIALFGWMSISSLLRILINGLTTMDVIFVIVSGVITIFCIWQLCMYLKKKTGFDKRNENQQSLITTNDILLIPKACTDCGSRLAVCEKNSDSNIIRLNALNRSAVTEYYCPSCDKHIDTSAKLERFIPQERVLPEQNGERHYILKRIQNSWLRVFAVFAASGVLLTIIEVRLIVVSIQVQHVLAGIISFGLLAFASFYLAYPLYGKWRASAVMYYEIVEDGLILQERDGKHFYAWDDFRIVTLMPEYQGRQNIYIFDLKQRVIMVDDGIEKHRDVAYDIIDHIRQIAKIDIRL